ncbi:MAG: hypothetical protein F6K48_02995 [Okeania sp. SIO3H1]|nr:hypothetical protein [Okeania sp. SIO3H1]
MASRPFLARFGLLSLEPGSTSNPAIAVGDEGTGLYNFFGNLGISVAGLFGPLFQPNLGQVDMTIISNTPSASPTTGALTVFGGVGVSGDLNVGGLYTADDTVANMSLGDSVSSLNPFGSLPSAPSSINGYSLKCGSRRDAQQSTTVAGWFYMRKGNGGNRPGAIYGSIALGENGAVGGSGTYRSYGIYAEARGVSAGGSATKLNVGVYGRAENGDVNWAGYFENAVRLGGVNNNIKIENADSTLDRLAFVAVKQEAGGITTTLWASPLEGDTISIRNAGGLVDNIIDGNGNNVDGLPTLALPNGQSVTLIFDGTEWTSF